MADKPFTAVKFYEKSAFILTDRKLSRVVEVATERLERIKVDQKYREHFEVSFRDGKELRVDSLENVLALDNSKKTPISRLLFTVEIMSGDDMLHGVEITFDASESYRYQILIRGESRELGWLQETMGALEEQVERTIPNDFAYWIKRRSSIFSTSVFLAFLLSIVVIFAPSPGRLQLPEDRVSDLRALSTSAKSETEKVDFVFRYLLATLEKDKTSISLRATMKTPRTYLIGVPIVVALVSAISAIVWLYPRYVFAWGDCGESYETSVARRKVVWYGVVLSLVVGILGNLFVVGATG
jgi:hypothetical protein